MLVLRGLYLARSEYCLCVVRRRVSTACPPRIIAKAFADRSPGNDRAIAELNDFKSSFANELVSGTPADPEKRA
jgi:hypothetical protein